MCRYALKNYRHHYVCFDCRKGFKAESGYAECKCPECGVVMTRMGRDFKVPRTSNLKQWRKVERLVKELDWRFESCGCTGPGHAPRLLSDMADFITWCKKGNRGFRRSRFQRYETPAFRI
jgi:DNA-directed RNA polymerase subunit RPC12/RpoP